jgi:hypothetical protein
MGKASWTDKRMMLDEWLTPKDLFETGNANKLWLFTCPTPIIQTKALSFEPKDILPMMPAVQLPL